MESRPCGRAQPQSRPSQSRDVLLTVLDPLCTPCVHPVPLWLCTAAATWQSASVADNQADYRICAVRQQSIEAVQQPSSVRPLQVSRARTAVPSLTLVVFLLLRPCRVEQRKKTIVLPRTTGGDEQPDQSYVYLWARVPGVRCS